MLAGRVIYEGEKDCSGAAQKKKRRGEGGKKEKKGCIEEKRGMQSLSEQSLPTPLSFSQRLHF